MNEMKLNLARKWRSKNFDQIVGQDLTVRILKNSLYKGQFFPVYLLSGQRGSGKTTTARVFAASVNCQALSVFQSNPQSQSIPCLICVSCQAMMTGSHPDFIEMDAASHTGVDNVRTIIEASSYLPLMGSKKIYLIDEAHMLSKAAFNALLKVLEEPPRSVIFMLATTDPQKIIDTVRSRCFQLIFKPIDRETLVSHLAMVCDAEGVAYEPEGLALLAAQSEGSARDALNLIEQVRFATKGVTSTNVLTVLGRLDDGQMIELAETALCRKPADLLSCIKRIQLATYSAEYVWQRLSDLARALIWARYGVDAQLFVTHTADIERLAFHCSITQLTKFMQLLYDHEYLFSRTTAKHTLIEMILLQLSGLAISDDTAGGGASSVPQHAAVPEEADSDDDDADVSDESDDEDQDEDTDIDSDDHAHMWSRFVKQLQEYHDPLVVSMIHQSVCTGYDRPSSVVTIELAKNLAFFADTLADEQAPWYRMLRTVFGAEARLSVKFTAEAKVIQTSPVMLPIEPVRVPVKTVIPAKTESITVQKPRITNNSMPTQVRAFKNSYQKLAPKNWGPVVDVSDVATWQKANLLLRYFPGTVHEITE